MTLRGAACLAVLLGATAARADPSIDPYFMMETDALIHSEEVEGENGFAIRRLRLGLVAHPVPWLTAVGIAEYASNVEPVAIATAVLTPDVALTFKAATAGLA